MDIYLPEIDSTSKPILTFPTGTTFTLFQEFDNGLKIKALNGDESCIFSYSFKNRITVNVLNN